MNPLEHCKERIYGTCKAPMRTCLHNRSNQLKVIGYSDSVYAGCVDGKNQCLAIVLINWGNNIMESGKKYVIATSTIHK